MKTIFMNTENSKTNEANKFLLYLSQRLDLRISDKHFALQNLSIYYTWKNLRKLYTNNIFKITAPKWIDELDLPDLLDIQDYIEYIIKKHKTLTAIPSIHVNINKINNRLVFKIKDILGKHGNKKKKIKKKHLWCSEKDKKDNIF